MGKGGSHPLPGGERAGEGRDILASHAEAERGGAILQRCGERQLHGEVRMETWGGNDGLKEWHVDAVMAQTYINLVNLSYYALSHHLLPHLLLAPTEATTNALLAPVSSSFSQ